MISEFQAKAQLRTKSGGGRPCQGTNWFSATRIIVSTSGPAYVYRCKRVRVTVRTFIRVAATQSHDQIGNQIGRVKAPMTRSAT